jgi:hypothetical protein
LRSDKQERTQVSCRIPQIRGDGGARDSEPREKLWQGKGNNQRPIAGFVFRKGFKNILYDVLVSLAAELAFECDNARASAQGGYPRAQSHSRGIGKGLILASADFRNAGSGCKQNTAARLHAR